MKENNRFVWFKGKIVNVNDAMINVLSPTSQFGANVFEGLRAYWNPNEKELYLFRLDDHVERLQKSIKSIEFESKFTNKFLKKSLIETIKYNNFNEDIVCRQTVFLDGFGNWSAKGPVDMFIAPIAKGRYYENSDGLDVCITKWERIHEKSLSPKIKMGANYMNSRMGQLDAITRGHDSAIFLNKEGTVSEGPGACLFMVKDNVLITPPLTASILDSITRSTILHIAENDLNIQVAERDIQKNELYDADELFMCGTAVEIVPIYNVDKKTIGHGNLGSMTSVLRDFYLETARGNVKKYKDWLTPIYKK